MREKVTLLCKIKKTLRLLRKCRRKRYTMTKREFLTAVAASDMNDEIATFAAAEIEKMDVAAEKRKGKVSKKALENQPIIERIVSDVLTAEPMTATDIAAALDGEFSVQKVSGLCRAAVASGLAVQTEVKVTGKGTQKAYHLA